MSLSSSLSSCSSGGKDNPSEDERDTSSSPLPSPKSINAILDDYVCAAKVGRAAMACGDIKTAVEQFDRALSIELQTEMDCMYDTSLGFMSGLVRKEVDGRLLGSPQRMAGPPACDKVMEELSSVYKQAESQATVKPADARSYNRMGTCLCCVNEWEKARKMYNEGLNMCKEKDKKELTKALRNLTRIEQIANRETPPDPYEDGMYRPNQPKPTKAKHRHMSLSLSPRHKRRPQSESFDSALIQMGERPRSFSQVHPLKERTLSDPPLPNMGKGKKRFSFAIASLKRPSSKLFSRRHRHQSEPLIDCEERLMWLEVFSHESTIASGSQGLIPSAIVHMRRLSLETLLPAVHPDPVTAEDQRNSGLAFAANPIQSLVLDGDDDDIEDFD